MQYFFSYWIGAPLETRHFSLSMLWCSVGNGCQCSSNSSGLNKPLKLAVSFFFFLMELRKKIKSKYKNCTVFNILVIDTALTNYSTKSCILNVLIKDLILTFRTRRAPLTDIG